MREHRLFTKQTKMRFYFAYPRRRGAPAHPVGRGRGDRGEGQVRVRVGARPPALERQSSGRAERIARTAQDRFSYPHEALIGANHPGTRRLYELIVRIQEQRSGRKVLEDARDRGGERVRERIGRIRRQRTRSCRRPSTTGGRDRSTPPRPGTVFARKLARRPIDAATCFVANFASTAPSAAASPRPGERFSSRSPGPASVCTAESSTSERLEGAYQRVHEPVVAADLAQAVADPARQRLAVLVPDANLVLDGCHHVVAERASRRRGPIGTPPGWRNRTGARRASWASRGRSSTRTATRGRGSSRRPG